MQREHREGQQRARKKIIIKLGQEVKSSKQYTLRLELSVQC